jgi:hypothetical protein
MDPRGLQELLTGEGAAGCTEKGNQQGIFALGEGDLDTVGRQEAAILAFQ